MIVRGDEDVAADEIFDRLIAAAMSVRQFIRARTVREREQLMAEADAEDRLLGAQTTQKFNGLGQVGRIARPG